MSVKIRLKRLGKIRVPQYRIVVVDSRTKRDGRVIEEIGLYRPKEEPSFIQVNSERAQHWLKVGAQPSDPVAAILKVTGDWQKFKGIDGQEGTLRFAAPKADKLETFNRLLAEAHAEPTAEAVTKSSKKKAAPVEEAPVEAVAEVPADEAAADETPAEA
ncbi:30S ribosomal protein S16 [Nocardioides baekrokdamisoli]|uniref:Small ribosomal subunit protein bS16 n=1 Tax=Nocardioides baekrokdamisoli TaxID=1804624 RepID=A0A3G9IJ61_9ACTN|nr:30S ribosomal protein S16 [Nocardioides baekrokdamisoli]BBH18212.1 30S ribosomal protein S16 [Nocardioides baekrokdamisoli]